MKRRIFLRWRMTIMPTLMILAFIKYTLSVTLKHSSRGIVSSVRDWSRNRFQHRLTGCQPYEDSGRNPTFSHFHPFSPI